jgi:hypothetical protein
MIGPSRQFVSKMKLDRDRRLAETKLVTKTTVMTNTLVADDMRFPEELAGPVCATCSQHLLYDLYDAHERFGSVDVVWSHRQKTPVYRQAICGGIGQWSAREFAPMCVV